MNYQYTDRRGIEVTERILQIEYWDGVPFAAVTIDPDTYRGATYHDFDLYGGDKEYLMFYTSGGGPNRWTHQTHAVSPGNQLWIDPKFRHRMTLNIINVTLIKEPFQLSHLTNNPFVHGKEVGDITFCSACKLHYDEDYCPIHDCEFTEGAEEDWKFRKPEPEPSNG